MTLKLSQSSITEILDLEIHDIDEMSFTFIILQTEPNVRRLTTLGK